jgi:hypothetical protein
VEVEFPPEAVVEATGAAVIAGELDGSSASLAGADELITASELELLAALSSDASDALALALALELPSASALELAASVLELADEALVAAASATEARTLVV